MNTGVYHVYTSTYRYILVYTSTYWYIPVCICIYCNYILSIQDSVGHIIMYNLLVDTEQEQDKGDPNLCPEDEDDFLRPDTEGMEGAISKFWMA